MLARLRSSLLRGIDADPCEVEVDLDPTGFTKQTVVGLPDAAVKESMERVRAALANGGYPFPQGQVLVNLAPADVRKEGPTYDLPIAVGLLLTQGVLHQQQGSLDPRRFVVAGELALDGRLRPIRGALAAASMAERERCDGVILPAENAREAAVVEGVQVYGARTLQEVVAWINGELEPEPVPGPDVAAMLRGAEAPVDFGEVRGQETVKRAIVVAAAGGHNLLMIGPAGTGKTMMAKALPGVLPPMSIPEALEVTRIASAAGVLPSDQGLVTIRPVRSPHHTASSAAIVGGGIVPRPGEISLAHRGVLFLDELVEFPRPVLETLRQPLEDRVITIARAHGTVRFPASFMMVAAMNPTAKGSVSAGELGRREAERYQAKLSGPLLDRIDVHVEAPAVPYDQLRGAGPKGTDTASMREQVASARAAQSARQGPDVLNGELKHRELDEWSKLEGLAAELLRQAVTELGLSARAYDKIRRVARTCADLDGAADVDDAHVAEAISYRLLDRHR
ncbi:MAG: YifB family Mg chelatase-like AAA ATPase [Planctomycetota bacterium]